LLTLILPLGIIKRKTLSYNCLSALIEVVVPNGPYSGAHDYIYFLTLQRGGI